MKIIDTIPLFKRYALYEKGMVPRSIKSILGIVKLLERETEMQTVKSVNVHKLRSFLYEQKQSKMWSNKTFRNNRQYLKSFFDFCIRLGFSETNPVDKIEKPKIAKSLPRCLSKVQIEKLLLETDFYPWMTPFEEKRNKAIIRTFLFTGIRLNELLKLKTQYINLEEREILIVRGKGSKDRIVPIHSDLYPYLKSFSNFKKKDFEYFFCSSRSDRPLTEKNLYSIIKKLRKACRFYFSPHMLRHTMGKLSIEANLNPFVLQSILGHSDISTTQIYVSVSTKSMKESFSGIRLI